MARRAGFDIPEAVDLGGGIKARITDYAWAPDEASLTIDIRLAPSPSPTTIGDVTWSQVLRAMPLRGRSIQSVTPQRVSAIEARLIIALG